jgi:hypothetical protein
LLLRRTIGGFIVSYEQIPWTPEDGNQDNLLGGDFERFLDADPVSHSMATWQLSFLSAIPARDAIPVPAIAQ